MSIRTSEWAPLSRGSLPLDGSRRLRGDVVGDAIDACDLVDDAARHRLQQVVGQSRPVRRHGVVARDSADDDGMAIGPLVAHDADAANVGQHGEGLPQLAVEAGAVYLLANDRVSVLQDRNSLLRDLTDDAHA